MPLVKLIDMKDEIRKGNNLFSSEFNSQQELARILTKYTLPS